MRGMARAAARLAAGLWRPRRFSSHVVMETIADADTAVKFTLDLYAKRGLDLSLLRNCVSAPAATAVNAPSSPSASRLRLVLPFRRCAKLRSLYNQFGSSTELRVGRVLEDLDTFVADISYRHVGEAERRDKRVIVTACMDRMTFARQIDVRADLELDGHVCWTGRSSLSVAVSLAEISEVGERSPIAQASFLMVSRATDRDEAINVPPLLPVTPEEKEAFDAAGLKKAQLQKADSDSTIRVPPNASESALVHKLFTSTLVNGANVLGSNAVWMHNATVHKAILMHSQQRNLYGKMFGGYIMAQAFEIAWICGYRITGLVPKSFAIDHIEFLHPIEVGSVLQFRAQVVFVDPVRKLALVNAKAFVENPLTGDRLLTNKFHFVFHFETESADKEFVRVIPQSYADTLEFIDGRRRISRLMNLSD